MTKSTFTDSCLTMADLFENPKLRKYLENVRNWHGYIRFLGLPDRRDNPDILIDRLFVEPLVTRRHVSPDEDPSNWVDEAETVFDVLGTHKLVVLLGDPGTGKSTLVNYLVWLLSRPAQQIWTKRMGAWLLPIPMVLRELRLREAKDFEGLVGAFLNHAMSKPLRGGEYLHQVLADGKAFILLDGIDEIGNETIRKNLRDAVFDGINRYPDSRWLLSSRIVGYDEVPFDNNFESAHLLTDPRDSPEVDRRMKHLRPDDKEMLPRHDSRKVGNKARGVDDSQITTRYIAPFDDQRIEVFARNWYVQREAAATRAGEDAIHLVRAVHKDDAILRLARTPNLLTMMALIHRVEATLPHGRALLYNRIAEAYLESIDKYRGVYSGAYNLPQKKRWLARVGYEMQRLRVPNGGSEESELLVNSQEVTAWLDEEMQRGGTSEGLSTPKEFLDYVGRRSGLFLPRGHNRYAFVHLSFQEYFAAVALEREVTGIAWARGKPTPLKLDSPTLAEWAGQSIWRETFAFLFELLASKEDWHANLLDSLYGGGFAQLRGVSDESTINLAQLLARLAVNSRSGLTGNKKHNAISAIVQVALKQQSESRWFWRHSPRLILDLLGEDSNRNTIVLELIKSHLEKLKLNKLSLSNLGIQDIAALSSCHQLRRLNLRATRVSDLGPLSKLTALQGLNLSGTKIVDLGPLSKLTVLEWLSLVGTGVVDLGPLSRLTGLESLYLDSTKIVDLSPLSKLTRLKILDLDNTKVVDLGPLSKLTALKTLYLNRANVGDLVPLSKLTALESLHLDNTEVVDLGPLSKLTRLKILDLDNTKVVDLGPLSKLTALKTLYLNRANVGDLVPLSKLTALESLHLDNTEVVDLGPLSKLTRLESLYLDNTKVVDVRFLSKLTRLTILDLDNTKVVDVRPLSKLTRLKNLYLSGTKVVDLKPLSKLTRLRRLYLQNTNASQYTIDSLRKSLPDCRIL